VVTKIAFEAEAATPKLTFKAMGYLPEAAYNEVKSVVETEVVASILGTGVVAVDETVAALDKPAPVVEKPKAVAKPKAEPKPEPKPVVVTEPEVDLNLDDLNFDD
jgi:outer membrane biosynthesis protein TonB